MRHQDQPFPDRPPGSIEARLARYLGADHAAALHSPIVREADIFLASSQLAGARYAISTYLPRRLLARQIAGEGEGPWLEWVDGALLFADVSGSTALAERLTALGREGAEVVTRILNSYVGTMVRIVEETGGDLLTFGGDALLVLFEGPDAARQATATALTMLRDLAGFSGEVPGVGSFPLMMHIGVEAGPVALVSAGHPQALRYSAMGATVTAVARAEAYSAMGELVLGPRAWASVSADASGAPVPSSPDFVRVHAISATPAPAPRGTSEAPTLALTPAALDNLARQLDRISPYLPGDLLARILADPNRPWIEADLRPVTVLFAQVVGLGALVETLPPPEAAAALDALLRPLQETVARLGGFVNKLDLAEEGDKLMVVFGAPVAYEDHAERAARAALLIMASLPGGDQELSGAAATTAEVVARHAGAPGRQGARPGLKLRIGLNTGNVFAGNVGTEGRKEYTVMGDAVNVAARVMAAAEWGEILCAAGTAALVSHALVCDSPRQVPVKGKREPLTLVCLSGERASVAPAPALPLLGRAGELAWLRGHLAGAAGGQGRAVRVQGEAGIGKSRLAAALAAEASAMGACVLSVRCLAYNSATPYEPWGEILRDLCGLGGGDDQATRAARLGAALAGAGIAVADWLPLMADLVRLEAEDNVIVRALDPGQRQARRFEIVLDLLRAAAQDDLRAPSGPPHVSAPGDRPETSSDDQAGEPAAAPAGIGQPAVLVISFDNLQWADQVSLDLWQYVAARIGGARILLLGLHRLGLDWGSGQQGDGAAVLELGPLSREAGVSLLDAMSGPRALGGELRERLVDRAAGNPLFLEELLRAIEGAQPLGAPVPSTAVEALPDSLSGLLLARIDRLDEPSRALLRVASVVGQRFPAGIVQSIHESDREALVRRLLRLDSEELTLTEREQPERIHLFRHALLQEVAYQSLLYARRRELHRRIGEYLEAIHAEELARIRAQYSGDLVQIGRNGSLLSRAARAGGGTIYLLAHHYRLSDQPERSVPYLLLAGHIARDDYANDLAIQHYRWALAILAAAPAGPRTWEAREALGDVLCTLGRYEEAIAEYTALLPPAPAEALLPAAVEAEVLRSWGEALEKQGRFAEALARLREAELACRADLSAAPPLLLAAIYADMGQVLRRQGEFDQALTICQTGLSMVRNDRRSAEDERIEADLQQLMATIYAMRGDYNTARFHFENALAAQEAIDDLYGCARSHNNLGYLAQLESDYARAVGHYGEAEALARKISATYVLSSVGLNAAYGYYRLDRYGEAEAACRAALALCEEMGDRDGIAKAYDTLGVIASSRGDYAEAGRCHEGALALHRELGSAYEEGNTLAMLALALIGQGRPAEARALAEQALEVAQGRGAPQLEAEALNALAEAELAAADAAGDAAEERAAWLARAADAAANAAAGAARIGSKLDQGVALRLCGEIAARREAGRGFVAHFEAAIELFAATKSGFETARTEARLGAALAARNDPSAATYLMRAEATFVRIGAAGELRRLGQL